jgi:predicted fused transcriptional regulator/phosphomethylpyrimidine kinase
MNRTDLEKRYRKELQDQGFTVIRARMNPTFVNGHYVKGYKDFANVFDLIAFHPSKKPKAVQVTSGNDMQSAVTSKKRDIKKVFPTGIYGVEMEIVFYYKPASRWLRLVFRLVQGTWIEVSTLPGTPS